MKHNLHIQGKLILPGPIQLWWKSGWSLYSHMCAINNSNNIQKLSGCPESSRRKSEHWNTKTRRQLSKQLDTNCDQFAFNILFARRRKGNEKMPASKNLKNTKRNARDTLFTILPPVVWWMLIKSAPVIWKLPVAKNLSVVINCISLVEMEPFRRSRGWRSSLRKEQRERNVSLLNRKRSRNSSDE